MTLEKTIDRYGVVDTPKPRVIEDTDIILKVTGSTVCGSDLHLLHGGCCSSFVPIQQF